MDFNDLAQKFTQKVKKLGMDTAEEVQKLNRLRKLNGRISSAKKQIESIYSEIGKKFYELHKDSVPEGFEELVRTISDKMVEIEQLKDKVREAKGVVVCPSCNAEVPGGERFCQNCGSRMPEPVEAAAEEDVASVVVDAEDVKDAAADVVEDVKDAAEEAKDSAADVAEDLKDSSAGVAENVKDAAEDLADAAKEKAGEIAEGAKEVAGNAADELRDAAENLKEDIGKMF